MFSSRTSPLLNLPEEIIALILSYIPRQDRLLCCIVCKRFLNILFGLNNGVFELFTSQINSIKCINNLEKVLHLEEISEIITHFVVTYPYESITEGIQEMISSEVKGTWF